MSKTHYSPLCNVKLWVKPNTRHFVIVKWWVLGFTHHFTYFTLHPFIWHFFLPNCLIVLFNNVNTVRSEMWLLSFPHHSCQKRPSKSLVFDLWFERLFQHLWCRKHNTHISSSQYSLIVRSEYAKRRANCLHAILWDQTLYEVDFECYFLETSHVTFFIYDINSK